MVSRTDEFVKYKLDAMRPSGGIVPSMRELKKHLQKSLPLLQGEWVSGRRKYERHFASAIGAIFKEGRYWDCVWKGMHLELKMGNVWLDLVRYSEYLLKRTPESNIPVVTLLMRYKEGRITDIYAVTTEKLIKALNLSARTAEDLLRTKAKCLAVSMLKQV